MTASNETTNYKLPLFTDNDQPTWLGDFNGAMNKIDADMNVISANASTALSASNNAVSRVGTVETTVAAVQTTANNALALAQTNEKDIANCAEKNHAASTPATYGGGTNSLYGHVKLVDEADPAVTSANSVALSPAACANHIWQFCENTPKTSVTLNKEWTTATIDKKVLGGEYTEFFSISNGNTITCIKEGYYDIVTSNAGGATTNTVGRVGVGVFKNNAEVASAFSFGGEYSQGLISSASVEYPVYLVPGDTVVLKCFGNFGTDTWIKHLAPNTTNTIIKYLGK